MTTTTSPVTLLREPTADYEEIAARFRPLFAEIGAGAIDRERTHTFAYQQVKDLVAAGFGSIRIPVALGGSGASLQDAFRLLEELGAADANIAHVFRNHWAFVEDRLYSPPSPANDTWLERFARGEFVGGGWTEAGGRGFRDIATKIVDERGIKRITGEKFYATGSLYSDWLDVLGVDEEGTALTALVKRDQPGVTLIDDWPGFGQKTTASGSARYENAEIDPDGIFPAAERFSYQGLFYQTSLLAVLSGIARASRDEGITVLGNRSRNYPQGLDPVPAKDAQLLQVLGSVSAQVFGASAALEKQAAALDLIVTARISGDEEALHKALRHATIVTAEAQVVIVEAVLRVTTQVFDALGASATSESTALDRHWRNARTLASHNPRVYKERVVGDFYVNGTDPVKADGIFSNTGGQGV
jgi:alkylation response protein AidB-like acyl-CoA dehydrogenase